MDVPSKMGPWMLRGWVLTDRGCPKCQVPLMRSPNGQTPVIHFCVSCDGDPSQGTVQSSAQRSSPRTSSPTTASTHRSTSCASTPPTDAPSDMESPLLHPIFDADTILRRRQQSDRASTEIGNRLLKGWAMLADECPNTGCYGVPLVRPPKPGGGKDPRKECVICGSVYVDEQNLGNLDHSITRPRENPTKERVDKDKHAENLDLPNPVELKSNVTIPPIQLTNTASTNLPPTQGDSSPQGLPSTHPFTQALNAGDRSDVSVISALESAERALRASLQALADRLNLSVTTGATFDPRFIGDLAEAIQKVTTALTTVRFAHQSERSVA
ncbi:hypothetical protein BDM02DRAFT_966319 [Thelephora ganbajun]|uniref:Uncharacterized protein n=1 Tax=Thelephora ganbajun TaxID=370292 RepID=A0ACB6ZNE9_THEGA|nr:hypothetical protein BDM02DRAFT_966319 [Thelephora ganbajun]